MKNWIIYDIETTGLAYEYSEIIEIAMVKIDSNFKILDTFHSYIKPLKKIPKNITKINGITNDMVKDSPSKFKVIPQVREFIDEESILVAYNYRFDFYFLNYEFYNQKLPFANNVLCAMETFKIASKITSRTNLKKACNHYNVELKNAHSAKFDTNATFLLFKEMVKSLGNFPASKNFSDIEIYEKIVKRVAKSGFHKDNFSIIHSNKTVLEKKTFEKKEVVETLKKIYRELYKGSKLEDISNEFNLDVQLVEECLLYWINLINYKKYIRFFNNDDNWKFAKEILIKNNNNLEKSYISHKNIFENEPNQFFYKLVDKFSNRKKEMNYFYKDLYPLFNEGKDISEISNFMKKDKKEIIPYFSKWLKDSEENIEKYRKYIGKSVIKKSKLKTILKNYKKDKDYTFEELLTIRLFKDKILKIEF